MRETKQENGSYFYRLIIGFALSGALYMAGTKWAVARYAKPLARWLGGKP